MFQPDELDPSPRWLLCRASPPRQPSTAQHHSSRCHAPVSTRRAYRSAIADGMSDLYRPSPTACLNLCRPSPTACLLHRYRRAGTQNDRLGESFPTVRSTSPMRVYAHVYTSWTCAQHLCVGHAAKAAHRCVLPHEAERDTGMSAECGHTSAMCCAPLESSHRGGHFEYRPRLIAAQ